MEDQSKKPIIVGFISDLMFTVRIEDVCRRLGFRFRAIGSASDIAPAMADAPTYRPGEALHGQGGALFARLTEWQPALLIFDLTNDDIPWRKWLATIKSSPATRRLPVLCFGPHVDTETLQAARAAGADLVVPRSRFSSAMPTLIEETAHLADQEALTAACAQPLDERAVTAIAMFNEGHYYKCHDFLEEAWRDDESAARELYRGILQVGIAYYQIERGNYRGAIKMLLRVRQWLDPLPAVCRTVDVARLREDVANVHAALTRLGEEGLVDIDRALFRPVRTVECSTAQSTTESGILGEHGDGTKNGKEMSEPYQVERCRRNPYQRRSTGAFVFLECGRN